MTGRIYATDKCFAFYSKFFHKEKKLLIPYSQVASISPPSGVFRQVAIKTGRFPFQLLSEGVQRYSYNTMNGMFVTQNQRFIIFDAFGSLKSRIKP